MLTLTYNNNKTAIANQNQLHSPQLLHLIRSGAERNDIHVRLVSSFAQHHYLIISVTHLPHLLAGLADLADKLARVKIPQLDPPIIATRDDVAVVKLQARHRVVVRAQAVEHAPAPPSPFDLILMDPPYATGQAQTAIDRLAKEGWLSPGG